jgi:MFS family permease
MSTDLGPSAPNLTLSDLGKQFWADAYGKEVQTAATYSYTWLADQFGHLAIGMVAHFLATVVAGRAIVLYGHLADGWPKLAFVAILVAGVVVALLTLFAPIAKGWLLAAASLLASLAAGWVVAWMSGISVSEILATGLEAPFTNLPAMLAGLLIASLFFISWELSAYRSSVQKATRAFPLDTKLLRDNAVIATVYLFLGAMLSFAFHLRGISSWPVAWFPISPWAMSWLILFTVIGAAIILAFPWLRQKITWQKAALPYLCRLADAAPTILEDDARDLQKLIDEGAPPLTFPCAILIGGPIGSGRTSMAAGIGTEFAFKNCKVRYLSMDMLLEFAASMSAPPFPDDFGPKTISYWPWSEAQVLIIDDIGPLIAVETPSNEANVQRFRKLVEHDLKPLRGVLSGCHTVWVFGDLRSDVTLSNFGPRLEGFAEAVRKFCSPKKVFMIELGKA